MNMQIQSTPEVLAHFRRKGKNCVKILQTLIQHFHSINWRK